MIIVGKQLLVFSYGNLPWVWNWNFFFRHSFCNIAACFFKLIVKKGMFDLHDYGFFKLIAYGAAMKVSRSKVFPQGSCSSFQQLPKNSIGSNQERGTRELKLLETWVEWVVFLQHESLDSHYLAYVRETINHFRKPCGLRRRH